ncbi:hypothetical protein D3C86_664950 [compost metagenome]
MPPHSHLDHAGPLLGKGRPDSDKGGLGLDMELSLDDAITRLSGPTPDTKTGDRLQLSSSTEPKSSLRDVSEKAREAQKKVATPETSSEKKTETSPETTVPTNPFNRKSPALQAQEAVIEKALAGEIIAFPNSSGATAIVRLAPLDAKKAASDAQAKQAIRLTVDGHQFQVTLDAGLDPKESLAKLADYISKVPGHLRPALKSVTLSQTPNPEDAYWARVYGLDSFSSAATAGGVAITIWNLKENPHNLNEGVFNHEMAHLIGTAYSTSRTRHAEMIPPGWEDAIRADSGRVSNYAAHNANEDFSEAWRYYLEARQTPEKLREFKEKYPNRSRILEAIYEKTFEGKFKVSKASPNGQGARVG